MRRGWGGAIKLGAPQITKLLKDGKPMKPTNKDSIIPFERLLEKQIRRDAETEVKKVYQITAGFQDPEPPGEEAREMFENGELEL